MHVNFGLRGKESDEDESYLRDLAARHEIAFKCLKVRAEERAARQGESVQEWARRVRLEAFAALGAEGWIVATAHHADDAAETALFRLARGSGAGALYGIKAWAPPLWRPLLGETKASLLAYLERRGIPYRTDASNATLAYDRNVVRHEVLPRLEELHPGAAGRIAACAADAQAVHEFCREELARRLAAPGCDVRELLRTLPEALARMALMELIGAPGGVPRPLTRAWLDLALAQSTAGAPFALAIPGGGTLAAGPDGSLRIDAAPPPKAARAAQHAHTIAETRVSLAIEPGSYAFIRRNEGFLRLGHAFDQDDDTTSPSPARLRMHGSSSDKTLRFKGCSRPWSLGELLRRWHATDDARRDALVVELDGVPVGVAARTRGSYELRSPENAGGPRIDLRYW